MGIYRKPMPLPCKKCGAPGFITTRKRTGKKIAYRWCKNCWIKRTARPQLKPDRVVNKTGYAQVRVDGVMVAEHRVVMEEKLGRPLVKGESVHHINGVRDDNRPENLELWVGHVRWGQRATDLHCPHCGKAWLDTTATKPWQTPRIHPHNPRGSAPGPNGRDTGTSFCESPKVGGRT